ncbi:PQQ-binding-like beta-propeller repeat protein [Flexivirga caeni]|nr:PQQ-binding-like beta-propeller repeat protein [Flexivirga caeni]
MEDSDRPGAGGWAGGGFVLSGAIVVGTAAFLLPADVVSAAGGRSGLRVLTVLMLCLLVAVGATHVAGRHRQHGRASLILAVLVAIGLLAWSVPGLVQQWRLGFPGHARVLTVVGLTSIVVGLLLTLLIPKGYGAGHSTAASAIVPISAAALVAIVAGASYVATPGLGVVQRTANPVPVPAIPSRVSHIAWRVRIPSSAWQVWPGGAGVVVATSNGVEGLDGTTGARRWSYRRTGKAALRWAMVSPDGRTVLLAWTPRGDWEPFVQVLDADTGRVRFSMDSAAFGVRSGQIVPGTITLSNGVVVAAAQSGNSQLLVGRSVTDGRLLWRYREPGDCSRVPSTGGLVAISTGVVLEQACQPSPSTGTLRFIDLGISAVPRWQYTVPDHVVQPSARAHASQLLAAPDGSSLLARIVVTTPHPTESLVLDARTGRRLHDAFVVYSDYLGVTTGTEKVIDLRTGRPPPGDTIDPSAPVILAQQTVAPYPTNRLQLQGRSGGLHSIPLGVGDERRVQLLAAPGCVAVFTSSVDGVAQLTGVR